MIALCLDHAARADAGAFTNDQLRTLKREGRDRATAIRGRFDWMRRDLLAVVGGNFYYEQRLILRINDRPCIWFNRDDHGFLLLNFDMPSVASEARARIRDNDWIIPPDAADVECPPRGRTLDIRYANNDRLKFEFFTLESRENFAARYPDVSTSLWISAIPFPSTGVEISEKASGTIIEFGPRYTRIAHGAQISNTLVDHNTGPAIQLSVSAHDFSLLHLDAEE